MPESSGTQTLEVGGIPDDILARLGRRAREQGTTPADYVRELIVKDVAPEMPRTFADILSPGGRGMDVVTDDEEADLVEVEVRAYRSERRMAHGRA